MAFGRGARTSLVDSVHAASELVVVFGLESVDAASAIELSAEDLVSLAESVELSGQVCVLSLEASGVFLESLFLGLQV